MATTKKADTAKKTVKKDTALEFLNQAEETAATETFKPTIAKQKKQQEKQAKAKAAYVGNIVIQAQTIKRNEDNDDMPLVRVLGTGEFPGSNAPNAKEFYKRLNLALPKGLMDRVDEHSKGNRTAVISGLLEWALNELENRNEGLTIKIEEE